jgi:hypothetical protein
MTYDVTTITGGHSQKSGAHSKPAEEFEMAAESQRVAVQAHNEEGVGPAYILQLSAEAKHLLAQRRHEQQN